MYSHEDELDIERFHGEGGAVTYVHMSDGHDVLKQDVQEYIKYHPGVHVDGIGVYKKQVKSDELVRKLTQ